VQPCVGGLAQAVQQQQESHLQQESGCDSSEQIEQRGTPACICYDLQCT